MRKFTLVLLLFVLSLISTIKVEATYFDEFIKDAPLLTENMKGYYEGNDQPSYYRVVIDKDSHIQFNIDGNPKVAYVNLIVDDGSTHGKSVSNFNTQGNRDLSTFDLQLKVGTYYFRLSGTGAFDLTYSLKSLTSPSDIEPNNSFEEANPLMLGTTVQNVGNIMGREDYYVFTLKEKSKITLSVENYQPFDSGYYIDIRIQDLDGRNYISALVHKNKQFHGSEILLPGTYFVKLEPNSGPLISNYQFRVDQVVLNQNEDYKNSIFSTNIEPNQKIKGFLSKNDKYHFKLNEDQKIKIKITTDSDNLMDALFYKKNLDGTETQITGYYEEDLTGQYIIIAQLEAGEYTINARVRWVPESNDLINYTIEYAEVTYPDVPKTHSSYKSIMYLSTNGIIQGHPDGEFKPSNSITRRQVFTMLSRDKGLTLISIRDNKSFKDVPPLQSDYFLIKPFYTAGIIDGYSNGTMGLNDSLTRGQLAKILVQSYNLKMKGSPIIFTDVSKNHFAYSSIEILASNGIALGYNGKFMPNEPVSREQFSLFLHRILQVQNN